MKKCVRRSGVVLLILTCLLSGGLGFGMGCGDARRVAAFSEAVRRWQTDPDFRIVQHEYVSLGSSAMGVRLCGIPAARYVMAFRSLPGLPPALAVSETSSAHYRAFAHGPLSAYLHLAGEQGVASAVPMVEDLGRREAISHDDARAFLEGFKLPFRVASDDGAVKSVRRLVRDTMPTTRPFAIRDETVVPAMRKHRGGDIESMSRPEQEAAMRTLDDDLRRADFELWRAKQVSDFLGGIWAQGYGQVYETAIGWFFSAQRVARVVCITTILVIVAFIWHATRMKRLASPAATRADVTVTPTAPSA